MPRFDAVGVIVCDMGRAIEFYRLVGLEFAEDRDGALANNNFQLMIPTAPLAPSD